MDRLDGGGAVLAVLADGVVLRVGVVGQGGRIALIQRCPRLADVGQTLQLVVAVVVLVGPQPVPLAVTARVDDVVDVVVAVGGLACAEGFSGQLVAEIVSLPVRGTEVDLVGRRVARDLGLIKPDLEAVASNLVLGTTTHGLLVNDLAGTVCGMNRRHWVVLLEGLLPLRGSQAVNYRGYPLMYMGRPNRPESLFSQNNAHDFFSSSTRSKVSLSGTASSTVSSTCCAHTPCSLRYIAKLAASSV